jgi:hypothetical protein
MEHKIEMFNMALVFYVVITLYDILFILVENCYYYTFVYGLMSGVVSGFSSSIRVVNYLIELSVL